MVKQVLFCKNKGMNNLPACVIKRFAKHYKINYTTKAEVVRKLIRIRKRVQKGGGIDTYRCIFCTSDLNSRYSTTITVRVNTDHNDDYMYVFEAGCESNKLRIFVDPETKRALLVDILYRTNLTRPFMTSVTIMPFFTRSMLYVFMKLFGSIPITVYDTSRLVCSEKGFEMLNVNKIHLPCYADFHAGCRMIGANVFAEKTWFEYYLGASTNDKTIGVRKSIVSKMKEHIDLPFEKFKIITGLNAYSACIDSKKQLRTLYEKLRIQGSSWRDFFCILQGTYCSYQKIVDAFIRTKQLVSLEYSEWIINVDNSWGKYIEHIDINLDEPLRVMIGGDMRPRELSKMSNENDEFVSFLCFSDAYESSL